MAEFVNKLGHPIVQTGNTIPTNKELVELPCQQGSSCNLAQTKEDRYA